MFHRLAFWKTKGMNPDVIYDIGANDGSWTRNTRIAAFPQARYEEFEANMQHNHPNRHMVLLGDSEKETTFYRSTHMGTNTGASMYLELTEHYTPGKFVSETLPVVPLDTYVTRKNLPLPDFMKLDVQGGELDVLRGAQMCLQHTKYALLEASLHRWNRGAPMIEDVIVYMTEHGFELIDIVDSSPLENYLFQVDLLFARKDTGLRRQDFYRR